MRRKIIAIDFDGTIVEDRFPEIGKMIPGAKKVINHFYTYAKIIIWTSRTGADLERAKAWLKENDIKYHHINESCPDNVAQYGGTDTRKIFADIYVDDKGLVPLPPDWREIGRMIIKKII